MIAEPVIPTHHLLVQGLRAKLQAAARAAWIDGMDFVHGPAELAGDDPFSTKSLFEPWQTTLECKGGPCTRETGLVVALRPGWRHYPRPDFSDMELLRFKDGRHDWRDSDWQDHCGLPGCEQCRCHETIPHDHL